MCWLKGWLKGWSRDLFSEGKAEAVSFGTSLLLLLVFYGCEMNKTLLNRPLEIAIHGSYDRRFEVLSWAVRVAFEVAAHGVNDDLFHLRISDRSDLHLFFHLCLDFPDPCRPYLRGFVSSP